MLKWSVSEGWTEDPNLLPVEEPPVEAPEPMGFPVLYPVPGWEGYAVSRDGGVWSLKPLKFGKPPVRLILSYHYRTLHHRVRIYGRSPEDVAAMGQDAVLKHHWRYVHHLVARAFHGPKPEAGLLVRHMDCDKSNNTPENLAYGDYGQNWWDSHETHVLVGTVYEPDETLGF